MKNGRVRPKIGNILFNILSIVTLIAVVFVLFNIVSGAKGYAVTSESMEKTLSRGDIVFSKKVSFEELRVGDVITVGSKELDEYFTHRIVSIDKDNKTIETKGDNNPEKDPMATPADRVIGKMWYSVPLLGYITISFGSVSQTKGLIILAIVAVALIALNMILTGTKNKEVAAMNKIRRIMTPVMAIVLVLCIGYFSGMSKTSAWFYDSGVIDSGDSFVFGNLSVNTKFVINHSVLFEATTKLADENEKFFDKAVNFDDVNVANSGTVPARVYINIDVTNGAKGYRWFVYTDDMLINGSIKETIKANVKDLTKAGLDEYNSSKYVLLAPGESKVVRIASWVEYDDVSAELMKGESLTIATRIYMTATQNTDGIID